MPLSTSQIQNAYVAFFNRPADTAGLNYWSSYAGSSSDLLSTFAQSAEYTSLFTGLNNTQAVNLIYNNLFGRDADLSGLNYWVGQLTAGNVKIANIADAVNKGAQGTDSTIVTSKTTAATAFTNSLDTVAKVVAYSSVSSSGLAAVKTWLSGVKDATTLATATSASGLTAITSTVSSSATSTVAGSTFTLTTGTNVFNGTAGTDTFDAGLSTGSLQTLNSGDILDGGSGTDDLFAVINSSVTPSRLTSIENIALTNITTASVVNLGNATGLTKVTNQGSTVGLTVSGIGTGVRVDVTDTSTADQVITFSSVTGTSDSATLGLSNVSGATTVSVLGIETLSVLSNGTSANTIATLTTDTATKLNVSGAMGLTITENTISPLNFVDASLNTATGAGVDIDMAVGAVTVIGGTGNDSFEFNAAGAVSAVGGAGNDTFTFAGTGTFTIADSVSGGDGSSDVLLTDHDDIVAITSPMTASTGGTVTGIERLTVNGFTDDATARAITLANISSDIATVRIDAITGGTDNTVSINYGVGSSTLQFNVAAAISAGDTLVLDASGTGTSDSLAIVNSRTATSDIGSTTSNITVTDFETVAINTGTYAVAVDQNLGVVDTGSTTAVTVSGGNTLILAANSVALSINASGLTGSAILSMGTAATIGSITGGANNDVLVGDTSSSINGGAGDDTVTGGTGNDTLVGGAGDDTITNSGGATDSVDAGAGNDTVVATLTSGNTISGGDGTADTLSIAAAATAATATGVSGFERLTFTGNANLSQDMSLFLDNNTFNRINSSLTAGGNTAAITGANTTVATLALTTQTTTTFARLVDISTNSLSIIATGGQTITAVTASDEETLNISSSNSSAVILSTVTATDLATLNFTGTGGITITTLNANSTTAASTLTINAAALTGALAVSATNSSIPVVFTGAPTAANTFVGSAGSDVITGGTAVDSITGGIGYDTITGGSGADSFLFANTATGTPSSTGNAFDIITDYQSGVDVIEAGTVFGTDTGAIVLLQNPDATGASGRAAIATGVVTFNIADNTLALRLTAVAASIANNNGDATAGDAAAGDSVVFAFGGDSYIFISDGTDALGATDVLIKLTGIAGSTSTDSLTIANGNITALA